MNAQSAGHARNSLNDCVAIQQSWTVQSFAGHAYSLTSKRLRSLMGHGFFSQKGMYTRASSPLPEAVDTVRAGIGTGQITYEFEE